MAVFVPPDEFMIYETEHWRVNHRCDATLPGYVMVGAKDTAAGLFNLPHAALTEMGLVLGAVVQALEVNFQPEHIHICRFGHDAGHSIHFHVIPIYDWVREAYDQTNSEIQADGPSLTLFVSENLTKNRATVNSRGVTVKEAIRLLRRTLQTP